MFPWKALPVYFVLISFSYAVLKTKPKNTVSLKGKRVEFKCQSDSQNPIDWSFIAVGTSAPQQFYFNGKLNRHFSSRYKVLTNESGQYDLIIDSVDFSYAGNYKCSPRTSENNQSDQWHSVQLVVLDSDPICKANSVNESEEYEIISAVCQLNYRGNAKPRMECTVNDDRAIINSTLTVNYTDSTYIDTTTLTNNTSTVITSSIQKLKNATITCNTTFILINSSNIDNSPEYFYLWSYEPKHRSNGRHNKAEGETKASDDSRLYVIIVLCICICVCIFIAVPIALRQKFCGHQKRRMSRNSEPDVLPIQMYGESSPYEEVQLQDRPGTATETVAASFDVYGEDVSCEKTGIKAEDGKVKLESGKKKSASYSVVSKKKKKGVVTGADGTVYTEVSVRPDCGRYVQPSDSPRSAIHRVENYVAVDHTWKCLPAPPKI